MDTSDRQRLFNISGAYRSRIWAALACVLSGIAAAGLSPAGERRAWIAPIALGSALGIALGILRSSRLRAERALADEQRWLEALPFSLEGWWALLAEDFFRAPGATSATPAGLPYTRLRVLLEFAESAPQPKQLHERLLAARLLELSALEGAATRAELTLSIAERRMPRELCAVVHRLVDDGLRPLHAEHPLSRVAVSRALDNK